METLYFPSVKKISNYLDRLKLLSCPHCHNTGFLNKHDTLHGPWKNKRSKIFRGRRAFCSNRGGKAGCGKTISLILSSYIKSYSVPSAAFWQFLVFILAGKNVHHIFCLSEFLFSLTTHYRLYKRFLLNQTKIRTCLCREHSAPKSNYPEPLKQTIEHMLFFFKDCHNPAGAFQNQFQTAFI